MKALDSLKMDIDDYNEVLASQVDSLYSQIKEIYENYYKMDEGKLNLKIQLIHDDIKIIANETRVLRKMESYYRLFKEEQDKATDDFDFMEAFEKWETEHTLNEKYKRQEVTLNELLRSKSFNCTDRED